MKKVVNSEYHRTGASRQNTKVLSDCITECDKQLLDRDWDHAHDWMEGRFQLSATPAAGVLGAWVSLDI